MAYCRLLIFDLCKIMAIGLIVTSHILMWQGRSNYLGSISEVYRITYGGLGVTIFLIVSGALLYYNHSHDIGSVKRFISRRLLRIYPAYWCSLPMAYMNHKIVEDLSPKEILLSILGVHAFFGEWGGLINPVSWFIGLICLLYLAYPWMSRAIAKRPYLTITALFLLSFASRWACQDVPGIQHWLPLCRAFEFGLGIFLVAEGFYTQLASPRAVAFLGDLSFYVFLTHYPLKSMIDVGIVPYIVSVLVFSGALYLTDRAIQNRLSRH